MSMENKGSKISKLVAYLKKKFDNPADRVAYLKKMMNMGGKMKAGEMDVEDMSKMTHE